MLEDVEVMPLALLYLHALAHTGIKKMRAPGVFENVDSLTGNTGTLVTLDNKQTTHNKVFVDTTLNGCVGIKHIADTIYGSGSEFYGNEDGCGGGKGVEGEDGESRGAVDKDVVEIVLWIEGEGKLCDGITENGGFLAI